MVNIICLNCNRVFAVHNYRAETAKFCSTHCYNEFRAKKAYEGRGCAYCGKPFIVNRSTRNTRYCSPECLQNARRRYDHSDRVCPQCGSAFLFNPSNAHQIFCSNQCNILSRTHKADRDFFKIVDTEAKAYVLGLMFSDGCIYSTGNSKHVNFSSKDRDLIETFRTLLESEHNIYQSSGVYSIVIGGQELYNDLKRLGLEERKSWKDYGIPKIPQELLRHFLRGVYDGDGCIFLSKIQGKYTYLHIALTCASLQFLREVKQVLEENGISPQKVRKDRSNYRLQVGDQSSAKKMVEYLYRGSNYFLKRKRDVASLLLFCQILL